MFWLLHTEETSREKLGCLQTNDGGKFISTAPKNSCKKKSMTIGYIAPYIYKENRIAERFGRILATIKGSILINSSRLVNF